MSWMRLNTPAFWRRPVRLLRVGQALRRAD